MWGFLNPFSNEKRAIDEGEGGSDGINKLTTGPWYIRSEVTSGGC